MHTRAMPIRTLLRWTGCAALWAFLGAGCSDRVTPEITDTGIAPPLAADEFSVLSYSLDRYGYHDRTGDGQAVDPKPEEEQTAIISVIRDANPDILAVQEIGGPHVFDAFREKLAEAGLHYDFAELMQRDDAELNIALFSRYPITATVFHLDDEYGMGDERVPVARGFLEADISINPNYQFRLLIAHLKSKAYHPLGQTEMRRNEARLLSNHIRRSLDEQPRLNLLVVGNMNDHAATAPLRWLTGPNETHLVDLRLSDEYGEIWTWFDAEHEQYLRYDYMLASRHMIPEWVAEKSRVIRHPKGALASDRRALLAVFRARDIAPQPTNLLPPHEERE